MSADRAHRLWHLAGLQVPRKRPRRRIVVSRPRSLSALDRNQVWAYDFVFDRCANGQQLKCLTVIDEYTRECLAINVAGSIRSGRVIDVLSRLVSVHGVPRYLRSDNGPEFVSRAVLRWLCEAGIDKAYNDPGKPWQSGSNGSFNGKFRVEHLSMHWFKNRADASTLIEEFRRQYNEVRPHFSFQYWKIMKTDYLILGSGLAALSFGALMANAGKKVKVIEAHEFPGGYGHTFSQADKYSYNAQLHYVWDCGEGQPVNTFLKKLGLADQVSFELFDPNGYDRMRAPGYALDVPFDYDLLAVRIAEIFPGHKDNLTRFIALIRHIGEAMDLYGGALRKANIYNKSLGFVRLIKFVNSTLQNIFDKFSLPKEAQTLLALQWPCFMLPPDRVSFFAWVGLVHGYHKGAYCVFQRYEHFVKSLEQVILANGGEILYENEVVEIVVKRNAVKAVITQDAVKHENEETHTAENIICNFDPKRAAEIIGIEKLSRAVQKRLSYEYSPSNFIVYCAVERLDLKTLGFGKSILYHTSDIDLNRAFNRMYFKGDYENPSFAISTPSLHTEFPGSCPDGTQLLEFITVADYQRFLNLKVTSRRLYRQKKKEILDFIIETTESNYIPNLRGHLKFAATGSPTTNERYCFSPRGNSYGSNLTPKNVGLNRLDERTSLDNFYFCNASAGFPGFAGTIATGSRLYEMLSGDSMHLPQFAKKNGIKQPVKHTIKTENS